MKKAAIFTTYFNSTNFGGLLQAYALQQALCDIDIEGIDVLYVTKVNEKEHMKPPFATRIKDRVEQGQGNFFQVYLFLLKKTFYKMIYGKYVRKKVENRNKKFKEFREEYIGHTDRIYSDDNLVELDDFFDMYYTGSDLVWNLGEDDELIKGFWLDFDTKKPKISYAASMPMRNISGHQTEEIKRVLRDYTAVSVREDVGYTILHECIKPTCEYLHVADPVFLLDTSKWRSFAQDVHVKSEKYILTYFLGDSQEHRRLVARIADERDMEIINIAHPQYFCMDDIHFGEDMIDISPMNFVWLLDNADMVVTDSFHGVAFSIIFHKEFYALDRFVQKRGNTLNDRLYSLLDVSDNKKRLLKGNLYQMYDKYSSFSKGDSCNQGRIPDMIIASKEFLRKYS